ncbi:MAG: hypothetical protein GY827_04830 [Cytophagales bacterium]|nr:hypothetical protein [Cytophagales bacterium]
MFKEIPKYLVDFKDLMDLGFKMEYMNCIVHQKQHGYDDFWVQYRLDKKHFISWEHNTRLAELCICNRPMDDPDYSIIERRPIENGLEDVKKYLYHFGHISAKEAGIKSDFEREYDGDYPVQAC